MSRFRSEILIILAFVFMTLNPCKSALAQADHCGQPTEALGIADWQSMKPSHFPFEVAFSNTAGWVGLNHVFGTGKHLQGRWRTAVPFLAPRVVRSFPERNAIASVNNPIPVFYLHATDAASLYPTFDPDKMQMLRLNVQGDHREIPVSTGITTFTFAAVPPTSVLVPISTRRLSQTLIELRPRRPLAPGQYLVTIGFQENDGFEFEIKCSQ